MATLLGYGEPQVLEVFKNTIPTQLYWNLFSTEDLRLAIETAKIILTKERMDRQLPGQSSSILFMNIRNRYVNKNITFDTQDGFKEKIDRLISMMSKLTTQDNRQN